jgi:CheY-like chemotaxis protein
VTTARADSHVAKSGNLNLQLSARRAEAFRDALLARRVAASRSRRLWHAYCWTPTTFRERTVPVMKDEVRVLVVDDLADTAYALAMALELDGYSVMTAHNGREAFDAIDKQLPHCVMMDVDMPDIDGCELSLRLREQYGNDIVLIAMSGRDEADARVAETFLRVDHYLRKPFELDVLRKLLPPLHA